MEDLNGALTLGQQICWDETHGYVWGADMNPDTDCSGFVGYCLSHNGFNVPQRWNTTSMIPALQSYTGFAEYIYAPGFQWQHGDIAVWDQYNPQTQIHDGHTFFYAENVIGYVSNDPTNGDGTTGLLTRARIEASSNRGRPQTGDQDNGHGMHPEVWVHPFNFNDSDGHTWHIFRWGGTPPPPPPPSSKRHLPIWLYNKIVRKEL